MFGAAPGHCSFSCRQDGPEPSAGGGPVLSGCTQRRVRQQTSAGRLPGAPAASGVRGESIQAGLQEGGRLRLSIVARASRPCESCNTRARRPCHYRLKTRLPESKANTYGPSDRAAVRRKSQPFSCINVERELHRSIVNPGQCHDFSLQRIGARTLVRFPRFCLGTNAAD